MKLLAVGCWLLACCASAATVEVQMRPEVELAAPRATLGQLAELSGPADAIAALAPIVIQELSATPVLVDERIVRARIGRQVADITVAVRGESRVRQPLLTIPVEELTKAASTALAPAGDDTEIVLIRASGPLSAADDGTEPRIEATPLDRGTVGEVPMRVRLLRGDNEIARGLLVLRVRRYARAAVLTGNLRRHGVIGAGDVALQRIELTPYTQDAYRSVDAVIGRLAIRDLPAGQPLTAGATEAPFDVRPGQTVMLVFRTGTVELAATGEALAAGRTGELVMVRRQADAQRVRGQVVGPGRVLVNF